jgi:hypothetical protein
MIWRRVNLKSTPQPFRSCQGSQTAFIRYKFDDVWGLPVDAATLATIASVISAFGAAMLFFRIQRELSMKEQGEQIWLPTERTSRDFVPWRFSNAGLRSAWIARRCRRPKTCTKTGIGPSLLDRLIGEGGQRR